MSDKTLFLIAARLEEQADAIRVLTAEFELRDAVIKEAKAFVAWDSPGGHKSMPDYSRLVLAIGALQATEGGSKWDI